MQFFAMRLRNKPLLATLAISIIGHAKASDYYIDPVSCNSTQQAFIRDGIGGAISMAVAGLTASVNPNPAEQQLIQWLFNDTTFGQTNIQSMFGDVFGVRRFTNEVTRGDNLGKQDLKIYCDQSRLKRRKNTLQWYDDDPDLGGLVQFKTPKVNCALTLAYTTYAPDKFWQIQLCPWFLNYVMEQKFQLTQNIPAQLWAKLMKGVTPVLTKWPYTPIDAASLFDKVMLHELTHTHAQNERRTIDVESGLLGRFGAYGWKNCRKLSTIKTDSLEDHKVWGCNHNADTYALYGSVALMISQGHTIHEDGTYG